VQRLGKDGSENVIQTKKVESKKKGEVVSYCPCEYNKTVNWRGGDWERQKPSVKGGKIESAKIRCKLKQILGKREKKILIE